MSKTHSPTLPTASPVAAFNGDPQGERDIIEACRHLAGIGVFGLIILDRNLSVVSTYGNIVDFIEAGKPLTTSLAPAVGLEDEILALRHKPETALELAAVSMATPAGADSKLNFTFFWNPAQHRPAVLVHDSASQTDISTELSRQIRARLMAEAAVTAKSKELARANADLESFASIISHDLKAPLRHMRHLIDDASARTEARGDSETRALLEKISSQSQRMSEMLSALLDYSTLGRKYEAIEPVDTRALVEAIKNSSPSAGHAISIAGHWPEIMTLRAPLDLVIRNLVTNALQHHDRPHGEIVLACTEGEHALTISIQDDGPGIDPRHHQAIFLPFRTLGSEPRETASGMGLAAVKKTISTIHGSIAVTSDPAAARGATFTVTWPKVLP